MTQGAEGYGQRVDEMHGSVTSFAYKSFHDMGVCSLKDFLDKLYVLPSKTKLIFHPWVVRTLVGERCPQRGRPLMTKLTRYP